MFDPLAITFGFFLISFLILLIVIGVELFRNLFTTGQSNIYGMQNDNQLRENSKEDSQADGLLLFDDPMFPEEFDDDDY
ncbi:MAG: hypothetical protein ACFCUE_11460 [Candidatus Bathyarchaeia archaeon]|jgi:hypothetical protein